MGGIGALDLTLTAFLVMPLKPLTWVWAALSGFIVGVVAWRLLAVERRGAWAGGLAGIVTGACGYFLLWYLFLLDLWIRHRGVNPAEEVIFGGPAPDPVRSLGYASFTGLNSIMHLGWRCVPVLVLAGAILGRVKRRELTAAEKLPEEPAEAPEMTQPTPETPRPAPRGSLVMGLVGAAGVVPAAVWPLYMQGIDDLWGLFWLWAALSGFTGGYACWRLLAARRPSLSQGFLAGLAGIYLGLCLYWLFVLLANRLGHLGSEYYPGLTVDNLPLPAAVKYVAAVVVLAYGNLFLTGWFSFLVMPGAGALLGRRLGRMKAAAETPSGEKMETP